MPTRCSGRCRIVASHSTIFWSSRTSIRATARAGRAATAKRRRLINATLKGTYAPVALPKREFMEQAKLIWERLGLPPLKPESPWHGYDLGYWPDELDRQARMATASDYFALGRETSNQRRNDVTMNTPVERDDEE
jgi:hypothetical protein